MNAASPHTRTCSDCVLSPSEGRPCPRQCRKRRREAEPGILPFLSRLMAAQACDDASAG